MVFNVQSLVDQITLGAQDQGMNVSPRDVGWIISSFLEGFILTPGEPLPGPVLELFQGLADGASMAGDET